MRRKRKALKRATLPSAASNGAARIAAMAKASGSAMAVAGMLVTTIGLAATLLSLYPTFAVSVEAPLDPPDPLTSPFVVTYTGLLPLRGFMVDCGVKYVSYAEHNLIWNSTFTNMDPNARVPREPGAITSGESESLMCTKTFDGLQAIPSILGPTSFAEIELDVRYSPVLMPWIVRHRRYPFWTAKQSDSTLRWITGRSPMSYRVDSVRH